MTFNEREYGKKWRLRNKKYRKEYIKEYYLKNKEHIKEYKKAYMKKYPILSIGVPSLRKVRA